MSEKPLVQLDADGEPAVLNYNVPRADFLHRTEPDPPGL